MSKVTYVGMDVHPNFIAVVWRRIAGGIRRTGVGLPPGQALEGSLLSAPGEPPRPQQWARREEGDQLIGAISGDERGLDRGERPSPHLSSRSPWSTF